MKKFRILYLILVLFLTGCSVPIDTTMPDTKQTQENDTDTENPVKQASSFASNKKKKSTKKASKNGEELLVHFIDVGQGDAALITIGSHSMLIDAGDNSKGTTVQHYLQKQGITSLDYVIGTHPDADHIGGMDVIIYKFDCKKVLLPDCSRNTATYRDVLDSIKAKGYQTVHPALHETYQLGDASFTITGPVAKYKEINDNSISLRLTYQDTSFLFMGDVTEETEPDILSHNEKLQSDVLKVAHHGSKYSTTKEFIAAVQPSYAVISCAEDNKYGFPSARVLNLLRQTKTKLYRTDEQGSLTAVSNGSTIQWSSSPSEDWKAGENTSSSTGLQGVTYIINTHTMKFHKADCRFAKDIDAKNKETTAKAKSDLLQEGYSPCGYCKP